MEKGALLYEGKAKRIYETNEQDLLWVEYKDDATAFDGKKKDVLTGKGRLNNEITSLIFSELKKVGIDNHFVEKLSANEQLVKRVEIIPLEVVVRNIAAGSFVKRLGIERGMKIEPPLVEFFYKNDELGDPLITNDHIRFLKLATDEEVSILKNAALKVNEQLIPLFKKIGMILVDFKLEFGRDKDGKIILADEISPDTCRLWDEKTGKSFDKDLFRFDLGDLQAGYETILKRLGGME